MAWDGWFTYDGNEIINVSRTEAYARHAGAGWFRGCISNEVLPLWDQGQGYRSPSLDPAPWFDRDIPESGDFYGFYPLNIEGIESSTRTAMVTESVLDGGTVGRIRHATRTVVFNGILVAGSDIAADYGMRWLKRALLGGVCENGVACSGGDLCYLAGAPCLCNDPGDDTVDDCVDPLLRTLRHLTFLQGPTVTDKKATTDGGAIWTVDFAGAAGNAFEFGAEVPVIAGFGDPAVDNIWVGPVMGLVDMEADIVDQEDCGVKAWEPIYDPQCIQFDPPPGPPSVPLGCYKAPQNWARRQFTIPKEYIPAWDDVVPVVHVHARNGKVSNLRLRFYADPYAIGDTSDDPCSFCGDIVLSYIPENNTMVFDAAEQVVYMIEPGGVRRRADSLVFATDGTPFEWPALTCGFGYIVTIDMEQSQIAAMPVVDLSLYPRAV